MDKKENKQAVYAPGTVITGVYKSYGVRFGFLLTDDTHEDIYIADENRRSAMNGDMVEAKVLASAGVRHRMEGRVTRIMEHANDTIVGTYEKLTRGGRVTPLDERIRETVYIPDEYTKEARTGARVIAGILKWPSAGREAEGKINELIGYEGDKGIDITLIIAQHKLPHIFSEELIREADHLPRKITIEKETEDFRDLPLVTIDGADAKDLDDAVYCSRLPNGHFELGVHIADVSRYVRPGTLIDQEAYRRGTSVYLADRVIPMLPFQLSNELCSLNAGADRYAMSCVMDVAPDGTVKTKKVTPSVIRVGRRCNYAEITKAFAEDIYPDDLKPFLPMLKTLQECADILRRARAHRGALDFDFPEYKVVLDESGKPLRIEKRTRGAAEMMIEDAMLAANEAVARFLRNTGNTAIYRIHDRPDPDKLTSLRHMLAAIGKTVDLPDEPRPSDIQKLLTDTKGTEAGSVIEMMTLRSLPQACYRTENIGHFGIASDCYTHFTSPIRRYPDLIVHRLIRQALFMHPEKSFLGRQQSFLEQASLQCSEREQASVEAERDVNDLKITEYMIPYVGESFDAHVTGTTRFGIFVGLDNGAEGLVSVDTMDDDSYMYQEDTMSLIGLRGGKRYMLGQPLRVTLVKADKDRKELDFVIGEIESPLDLEKKIKLIGRRRKEGKKEDIKKRKDSGKPGYRHGKKDFKSGKNNRKDDHRRGKRRR